MCPVRYSTPFPRLCPARKFSCPSRITTRSIFSRVYFGKRANSAAIHPRLRVILRSTSRRCTSVQSGNASLKLNSAVLRSLGRVRSSRRVPAAATLRATGRGRRPSVFTALHATVYCSHSFIRAECLPVLSRQYDRLPPFQDTLSKRLKRTFSLGGRGFS